MQIVISQLFCFLVFQIVIGRHQVCSQIIEVFNVQHCSTSAISLTYTDQFSG